MTTPLKEAVIRACDQLTEEATRAGAVNTIFFGSEILGHNTDGVGARTALETIVDEPVALKRIGVLGYGATARAILSQLQENDVYTFVWGRDPVKVRDVCERYDAKPFPQTNPPEIIVSTLPPSVRVEPEVLDALMRADVVMDANYGERSTLHRQAEREIITGEMMLEAQARASFDFWLAHVDGVGGEAEA